MHSPKVIFAGLNAHILWSRRLYLFVTALSINEAIIKQLAIKGYTMG